MVESEDSSPQAVYQQVQKGERSPLSVIRSQEGAMQRSEPLLHWAIRHADLPLVKLLLEKGADIHATDAQGNTPLMLAAWGNPAQNPSWLRFKQRHPAPAYHLRIVGKGFFRLLNPHTNSRLLTRQGYFHLDQQGFVVNEQGYGLEPPLNLTKQPGTGLQNVSLKVFKRPEELVMAEFGLFRVNQRSGDPEQITDSKPQENRIEDLSEHGDPVSAPSAWTPSLQIELLQLLLAKGADLQQKNPQGGDAFNMAIWAGQIRAALFLLNQSGLNEQASLVQLHRALEHSLWQSDPEMLQALLEQDFLIPKHYHAGILAQKVYQHAGEAHLQSLLKRGLLFHQPRSAESPLFAAARTGQITIIPFLLNQSGEIHKFNLNRETALFVAAEAGHLETVKLLLEKDPPPHWPVDSGDTPLSVAARRGHQAIVAWLLAYQPSIAPEDRSLALIAAAEAGQLEMVKFLLEKGVSVNATSSLRDKTTALTVAADKGHTELVKELLERGADPKIRDENQNNALDYAEEKGHKTIYQMLCQFLDIPANPKALQAAVEADKPHLVHEWVFKGLNPNQTVFWKVGETEYQAPLIIWAVYKGNLAFVQVLVKHGADLASAKDQEGDSALTWAVWNNYPEIVAYLLQKGLNPNQTDLYGNTSLTDAVNNGNLELTELLLQAKANPNHKNNDGYSILIWAVEGGNLDIIKHLMALGVDLKTQTPTGWTATMSAAYLGQLDILKYFISKGASLKDKDHEGMTLLMAAASTGKMEVVKYLLSQKVDPKIKNKVGKTALDLANEQDHADVVKLLKGKS